MHLELSQSSDVISYGSPGIYDDISGHSKCEMRDVLKIFRLKFILYQILGTVART